MRIRYWSSDVCSSDLQGIDGTAMQSFSSLPSDDRWALAFCTGHFAFSNAAVKEGERLWKTDPGLRQRLPDLAALAGMTPEALAKNIGTERADSVIAYLRRHPEAVVQQAPGPERSEEHTSELQSIMRISYAVFCLKK